MFSMNILSNKGFILNLNVSFWKFYCQAKDKVGKKTFRSANSQSRKCNLLDDLIFSIKSNDYK